jgi:hypothetical protein
MAAMQSLRSLTFIRAQQAASQKRGTANDVVHKGEGIQTARLFKL